MISRYDAGTRRVRYLCQGCAGPTSEHLRVQAAELGVEGPTGPEYGPREDLPAEATVAGVPPQVEAAGHKWCGGQSPHRAPAPHPCHQPSTWLPSVNPVAPPLPENPRCLPPAPPLGRGLEFVLPWSEGPMSSVDAHGAPCCRARSLLKVPPLQIPVSMLFPFVLSSGSASLGAEDPGLGRSPDHACFRGSAESRPRCGSWDPPVLRALRLSSAPCHHVALAWVSTPTSAQRRRRPRAPAQAFLLAGFVEEQKSVGRFSQLFPHTTPRHAVPGGESLG